MSFGSQILILNAVGLHIRQNNSPVASFRSKPQILWICFNQQFLL